MNQPFFSIVIPTKNRPEFLRDTISSVLLQDFDDFELIVSDNFNDEKTKKVIDEFNDNRLIYLRPEKELNIPDHWEFATKNTKGLYTLILTDRSFLRQGSLKDIHKTISQLYLSNGDAPVCFWDYGYYDEVNKVLKGTREEEKVKLLKPEVLARAFCKTLYSRYLPRPHVGCYRSDLIDKIKRDVGRLYMPFGPDYTSAFLALAYSDTVMYIPRPLVFFQGAAVSAGTSFQTNPWSYVLSLNVPDPFEFVPIKSPITSSLLLNDFLKIKHLVGGNLQDIEIDWVYYFGICYVELMKKKMVMGMDKQVLAELFEEWKKALLLTDKKTQTLVKREIRRRYPDILKSYLGDSFLGDFLISIKRFLLRNPTFKFENALMAGRFKRTSWCGLI